MALPIDLVQSARPTTLGGLMPDSEPGLIRHADGDEMRERIIAAIEDAKRPFNTWAELADTVGTSRRNVQYHVKRLRAMGRVRFEARRPWTLEVIAE